jgi:hypothetical protein
MGNVATASGQAAVAMGQHVTAGPATNTVVIGKGADYSNPLVNNVANSLMVGFGTTTPTLFVGGTNSRVGILTSSPQSALDVNGTVQATTIDAGRVVADGIIGSQGQYVVFSTTHMMRGITTVSAGSYAQYGDYMPYVPVPVPSGVDGIYGRLVISRDTGGHLYARVMYKQTNMYLPACNIDTDGQSPAASGWWAVPQDTRLLTVQCYRTGADCSVVGLSIQWAYKVR